MKKLWFVLIVLVIFPISALAATRYTDDNGALTSTGCTTRIVGAGACTATYAMSQMAAGDTLIFLDGTYNVRFTSVPNGVNAGTPTIVKAENANGAVIRPSTGGNAVFLLTNPRFITFDGLDVDATNVSDDGGYDFVSSGTATDMTVKNGKVHNCSNGTSGYGCILSTGPNLTVTNMEIYTCGNLPANTPGREGTQHCIYVSGASSGALIANNIIHDGINGYGITIYNPSGTTNNVTVRNNKVYNHNYYGAIQIGYGANQTAYNNIVYGSNRGIELSSCGAPCSAYNNTVVSNSLCVFIRNGVASAIVRNNICYQNMDAIIDAGTGTTCSNNLNVTGCGTLQGTTNPFVSASTQDFHLVANDDLGFDLTSAGITTDYTGATRSTPPDRGAYEFLLLSVRYIATTGLDANSCDASKNSATPKQNFTGTNGAIACMSSGDVLVVSSGTYAEALIDIVPAGVTIRANTANGPILRPASGTNVVNLTHDGIILDGLDIDGVNVSGSSLTGAVSGGGASSNVTVKNGTIRNGGSSCVISFSASTFQNNDVYGCGWAGIQLRSNNTVDGNRIRNAGDAGVLVTQFGMSSDGNTIRNNVIYNNAAAGLAVDNGSANTTYNNILYGNAGGFVVFDGGTANRSYNNTIYNNAGWCVDVDTGMQSTQIVNNICLLNAQGAIRDLGSNTTCTNNLNATGCGALQGTTNPFINAPGANFKLSTDDNGGAFLPAVVFDIDNVARSNPPDRGVYEFAGIGVTAGTSIFDVRGMR